jgi:hypothetical protein
VASYGSVAGVEQIAVQAAPINDDTNPTSTTVETWLAEGKSIIDQRLSSAGYTVPVTVEAAVYPSITALNNLYGAAYVLRAKGLTAVEGQREAVSETYLKDFYRRLDMLLEADLTVVGIPLLTTPSTNARRRIRSTQMRRVDGYSDPTE